MCIICSYLLTAWSFALGRLYTLQCTHMVGMQRNICPKNTLRFTSNETTVAYSRGHIVLKLHSVVIVEILGHFSVNKLTKIGT